jgi:hypothetical protein
MNSAPVPAEPPARDPVGRTTARFERLLSAPVGSNVRVSEDEIRFADGLRCLFTALVLMQREYGWTDVFRRDVSKR